MTVKRPAFQFYPADWRKDAALQSCSLAAQGLWMNALCIAHECEPYGHLTINGQPMTVAQLGRLVGATAREAQALVDELLAAGAASRLPDGTLFSRRMVRDEEVRAKRAAGGVGGADHGAKGAAHGQKGGRPKKGRGVSEPPSNDANASGRGVSEPPIEPPPSSSASAEESPLSPFELEPSTSSDPPWLPADAWAGYLAMRRAKQRKAPFTDRARALVLASLERLKAEGQDVAAVLDQSVRNGWTDVYAVKAPMRANGSVGVVVAHPSSATPDEATMRRISEAHGGLAVERLPDGRYRCGVHYFRPDGRREVLA